MNPEHHRGKKRAKEEIQYAAQMASLFMTSEEIRTLANGQIDYKRIYKELLDQETEKTDNTYTQDPRVVAEKKLKKWFFNETLIMKQPILNTQASLNPLLTTPKNNPKINPACHL